MTDRQVDGRTDRLHFWNKDRSWSVFSFLFPFCIHLPQLSLLPLPHALTHSQSSLLPLLVAQPAATTTTSRNPPSPYAHSLLTPSLQLSFSPSFQTHSNSHHTRTSVVLTHFNTPFLFLKNDAFQDTTFLSHSPLHKLNGNLYPFYDLPFTSFLP